MSTSPTSQNLRCAGCDGALEKAPEGMVVALCERSRQPGFAQSGLSTRAALTLMRSAMATALWSGRSFVTPDDVKAVARPVMAHRMNAVGSDGLAGSRAESEQLVERLLSDVAVPL